MEVTFSLYMNETYHIPSSVGFSAPKLHTSALTAILYRGGSRNVEGALLIVHVQGRRKQLVVALAVHRGAKRGKIFSPSFFSRLDWLS